MWDCIIYESKKEVQDVMQKFKSFMAKRLS